MSNDPKFIDGLIVKAPHERAPEYVKAKLSIKREELIAWLQQQGGDWINADVKVSQDVTISMFMDFAHMSSVLVDERRALQEKLAVLRAKVDVAPATPTVPDGWREDVALAAQMLTWGWNNDGLGHSEELQIEKHQAKLFEMLAAAPAAPAAVVDDATQDAIDSILHKLEEWSKAYPLDVFPEPTEKQRDWLHEGSPGLMDRVSASMGRHMSRMLTRDIAALRTALSGIPSTQAAVVDEAQWQAFAAALKLNLDEPSALAKSHGTPARYKYEHTQALWSAWQAALSGKQGGEE